MLTDAQRLQLAVGIERRNTRGKFPGSGGPNDMLRKALQKIVSGWIALGGPSGEAMEALARYLLSADDAHREALADATGKQSLQVPASVLSLLHHALVSELDTHDNDEAWRWFASQPGTAAFSLPHWITPDATGSQEVGHG